jgi:3-hydroxyisobutyrate dehydrogenase
MAGHIQQMADGGFPMIVYNRTESKTADLAAAGARVAKSIDEVAENSDIVFTIVAFPADVRSVYLGSGSSKGVLALLKPGSIVVDMTTSEPGLAREVAEAAAARGIFSLDAPVSGGDIGARNATLSIMIGGEQVALDVVRPLFNAMGKTITLAGGAGSGQHTKMVSAHSGVLLGGSVLSDAHSPPEHASEYYALIRAFTLAAGETCPFTVTVLPIVDAG